jgi:alkyl hydroperoxide reductase subunit AhpC
MSEPINTLRVGQQVPDFKLETFDPAKGDFSEFSLATQKAAKKWTVIFFYPADFTFVCATEFAALADQYEEFKKLSAEVITVSTDTKFVHLAWQRDEKMLEKAKYPMGSDRTGSLARMFGVYDETSGNSLRGAFIISPDGTLLNLEINFYNLGRNVDELLRKFKANIHLAENPAEVCPAQWKKEGDKTLKPSAKIVGKIYEALK